MSLIIESNEFWSIKKVYIVHPVQQMYLIKTLPGDAASRLHCHQLAKSALGQSKRLQQQSFWVQCQIEFTWLTSGPPRADGRSCLFASTSKGMSLLSWYLIQKVNTCEYLSRHLLPHRPPQLHPCFLEAFWLGGVDNEDDAVSAAGVGAPQRADLLLPAHVPHQES